MDRQTLADCTTLLGRGELEVERLFEDAELLPALIARIGVLMLATHKDAPQRDAGRAWCTAVATGWGASGFTSAELLAWAEQEGTGLQREVLAASRELCSLTTDADLSPHRLGVVLAELAAKPGRSGWRVAVSGQRRGANVWVLRDARG